MAEFFHEYRIRLPFTLQEFQVGQRYGVGEASKDETGGGEGWKWVTRELFEGVIPGDAEDDVVRKGHYTHKILYLGSKFPNQYRCLSRQSVFEIHEKSWNCFPYVVTEYTNPNYMKENFRMRITTIHTEGTKIEENVHGLPEEKLKSRSVELLDIVNDFSDVRDFKSAEDPTTFRSAKRPERGPLKGAYWIHDQPVALTAYKLVHLHLNWNGWEHKLRDGLLKVVKRTLLHLNRKIYCLIDNWVEMSLADIDKYEETVLKELDSKRDNGSVIGTKES